MGISQGLQPDQTPNTAPAGAPHSERSWAVKISGQQPAFAWAVAAILGGVSISAAPRDTFVRLLLPVGVMFTYVWLTYPRESVGGPGLRATRVAQLADSAYFLGFLWTLWALIDSFVLKRATGAETAFRVFGYALVTTAAGMATRLYLLQFKYGASDQAAEAEFTVEHKLQVFSESMLNASESIELFHTYAKALNQNVEQLSTTIGRIDRQIAETHQQTTKAIKDNITTVVEDIRGALKTPAQEYGRAIRAFTANVNQQSQLFSETLQKASANVDHAIVPIVDELQNLSRRMASIDIPSDGLKKMADSFNEVERAVLAVAGVLRPDGQLRVNLVRFGEEVQVQTDTVAKALASITARLNSIKVPPEIVIDIGNVIGTIDRLQKAVEALLQGANDQRWEKAPQTASDALLKLTMSVNKLRESVDNADTSAKRRFWPWS